MKPFPHLFSPAYIGRLLIKNRVVMAPMAVSFSSQNGEVTDTLVNYYQARAQGGTGLIIVEAACVDTMTGKESLGQLTIDNLKCVPGLGRLSKTVKACGSRVFIQLFHAGRQTLSQFIGGNQPVAPSPIPCPVMKEIPRQLEVEEIKKLENKFIRAAAFARMAEFDGVEIHAAHGYLVNQFLSPASNKRQDEYGGSLENRMRFLLNIIKGIKQACPGLAISVRINIDDFIPEGLSPKETGFICRQLEKAGVDLINCSCGTYESGLTSIEPASYPEGWRVYLAEEIKKQVKIPVMTGGIIRSPQMADSIIAENKADFVFLGRSLLADSNWANKASQGREKEIRPCIMCNQCIGNNFKGLAVECTVNPTTGREAALDYYVKSRPNGLKAVVVGSGPAGMQSALSLTRRGFDVSLYEQKGELGGMLNLASRPPCKQRISYLRDYLVQQLNKSPVSIYLNHMFSPGDVENNPDIIVLATGSQPYMPKIKGLDSELGCSITDILEEKIRMHNQHLVVIGGGSNGCEVADFLAAAGNQVTIVEQQDHLAPFMERKNRRDLINRLQEGKVSQLTSHQVLEIVPGEIRVADKNQVVKRLTADYVVLATGFIPDNSLYLKLQSLHPNVHLIGDAFEVGGIKKALLQGEIIGHAAERQFSNRL